jgi:DNA primase
MILRKVPLTDRRCIPATLIHATVLPPVVGRPLSLTCCPEGLHNESFHQKHAADG